MSNCCVITVVAGIIWNESATQLLISRRVDGSHLAGSWEFPGGKLEQGESLEQALARELMEELNITFSTCRFFSRIVFEYPEKKVELHFYEVMGVYGDVIGRQGQEFKWIDVLDLPHYRFPEANEPVVNGLLEKFKLINNVIVG
jgi:8-oxo-dGTP diphosphatase